MAKLTTNAAISGGLGLATTLASNMFAPATDSNTGVGGAVSGALSGASAGAALGPWGAVGGAAVGFLGSALKGAKITQGDFYGNGLSYLRGGIFAKSKRKQYEQMQQVAAGNRIANTVGTELQSLFDEDYDDNVSSLANGGMAGQFVKLNHGELFKTPDGELHKTTDFGEGTDQLDAYLPNGTRVTSLKYSDMIVNGLKTSKGKDRFAEGTNAANKLIASKRFEKAYEELESKKAKKAAHKFAGGGVTLPELTVPIQSVLDSLAYKDLYNKYNPYKTSLPYYGGKTADEAIRNDYAKRLERLSEQQAVKDKRSQNWLSAIASLGSLAPAISNMFASEAEPVRQVDNPYVPAIKRLANRQYNNSAELNALRRNRAINNYNFRNFNTNSGANMAMATQAAVNYNNALADLYARTENVNNSYAQNYANTLNNLGGQYVAAANTAMDLNAQNQANTRNIRRTGYSQLGQWAQTQELMRNTALRDAEMLPLYRQFLSAGSTADDLALLYRNTKKNFGR